MKSSRSGFARLRPWILGWCALGLGGVLSAQPIATVGDLLAGVRAHDSAPGYFVIPVAGHVDGANGTEFRTDVTILAFGQASQRVAVAWLAQGRDSSAQPVDFFDVGPLPASFPDMTAQTLGKEGLGALVVAAVAPDGSFDFAARLSGFARVWTPVSGCPGTASLSVAASRFTSSLDFVPTAGLLLDAGHRGTVGFVNPDTQAQTFTATILDAHYGAVGEVEVSVPAASMRQVPLPTADVGAVVVYSIQPHSPLPVRFAGYAASISQLSGDGWLLSFDGR